MYLGALSSPDLPVGDGHPACTCVRLPWQMLR